MRKQNNSTSGDLFSVLLRFRDTNNMEQGFKSHFGLSFTYLKFLLF